MTKPNPPTRAARWNAARLWRVARFGVLARAAVLLFALRSHAGFVYESGTELLTSGDFNGDGLADVLVLDKATGNARVGYQSPDGSLTWSSPLPTGVENVSSCAPGRFIGTTLDALAVTAADLNHVNLVDLSHTNSAGSPLIITPAGIGPHALAALSAPQLPPPTPFDSLVVASALNNPPSERLDLLSLSAGVTSPIGQYAETGLLERLNALQLATNGPTFLTGLLRGTNDALRVWQFTNSPSRLLSLSNQPAGSDYADGVFNGEALPRFLLYVPGGTNIEIVPLQQSGGHLVFGPSLSVTVSEPIQRVFYLENGSDGSALIEFGDGVQALRLPGGSPGLSAKYSSGAGAAGNVFTGVVPLGAGRFALLDAPPGDGSSVHAQVIHFDGVNFTQLSSGNLPSVSTSATRANVWLFQTEPFVNRSPGFIASLTAADWSDAVTGLPGSLAVRKETDGGPSAGLGSPGTNNLGAPPSGSAYAIPNQYAEAISVFTYAPAQAAQPVTVTISPPPGIYDGPISISFSTLNAGDHVFYRTGAPDTWHQFTAAFMLTNDATIQYYGTDSGGASRSRLQFASYSLGNTGETPPPPIDTTGGTGNTNPPPVVLLNTNLVLLSPNGTVFYGRASATGIGTIWAINLDGSSDTYITTGARPRVSRNGRWMAFLRGGSPLVTQGNLWMRDMQSGAEWMVFSNQNYTIGYDWDRTGTNLVFDWSCWLWQISLSGTVTALPLATDCYDDAPVVNPVDGRLAFHNLNSGAGVDGIYVTGVEWTNKQNLNLSVPGASWPSWSPDGQRLAFVDGNSANTAFTADGGKNLYTVHADGSDLNQISTFTDSTNGFPHGLVWSPDESKLVGAGFVFGTNGIWVVPMTPEGTDCSAPPTRLPTTPGDPISWVGSIVAAPPPPLVITLPGLFIRREPADVVVYWATNFAGYTLESTTNPSPRPVWIPVSGPFSLNGAYYEYREPKGALSQEKLFRLNLTGGTVPVSPQLFVERQGDIVVLYWQSSFVGFTLEATSSLSQNSWAPISGPYPLVGGYFEYQESISGSLPGKYYRLRSP